MMKNEDERWMHIYEEPRRGEDKEKVVVQEIYRVDRWIEMQGAGLMMDEGQDDDAEVENKNGGGV